LYILSFVFYPYNCHRLIGTSCKPFLSVIIISVIIIIIIIILFLAWNQTQKLMKATKN